MNFYLATSDKTSHILTAFAWLADKYIPEIENIFVLGYSSFPSLPERYKCISLAPVQNSRAEWAPNLLKYISSIKDEYIIFGLEDFLITRSIDYEIFNTAFEYMKSHPKVVRYELGEGHPWHPIKNTIASYSNYRIYEYDQTSLYRISTQFSIWRTSYLVEALTGRTDPWNFELEGSKIAMNNNREIIATDIPYALHWVHSALSEKYPNMINVLGIKIEDIESLISLNIFEKNCLQLGIHFNSPRYICP